MDIDESTFEMANEEKYLFPTPYFPFSTLLTFPSTFKVYISK